MHSTHNEGKSVFAKRFIRTLIKKKNWFISIWQLCQKYNVDKLDDIVDKYNNTYHKTIKMKPIDVKFSSYPEYGVDSNTRKAKFKIGDHVRISK